MQHPAASAGLSLVGSHYQRNTRGAPIGCTQRKVIYFEKYRFLKIIQNILTNFKHIVFDFLSLIISVFARLFQNVSCFVTVILYFLLVLEIFSNYPLESAMFDGNFWKSSVDNFFNEIRTNLIIERMMACNK